MVLVHWDVPGLVRQVVDRSVMQMWERTSGGMSGYIPTRKEVPEQVIARLATQAANAMLA
jgi:hypothetical protein